MRVDTGSATAASTEIELDPQAKLRHYVGAFRRRWYLLVAPALLGALLGWFTTPQPPAKPAPGKKTVTVPTASFYKATHVLILEPTGPNTSSGQSVNLAQTAYLINTGEVPVKVAAALGLRPDDVESRLIGVPRDQVGSIEVQAVGKDPDQVVKIADAAATELLVTLKSQAESNAATSRDKVLTQLNDLDAQLNDLNARIAANPPDREQLVAQQRSLSNQYSIVFEQFTGLANTPAPTAGLVSLENAKARPISEDAYKEMLRMIRDGASYVTGSATTVPAESDAVSTAGEKPVGGATRGGLGGLAGLMAGVGLVLVLDRFDGRLRRRKDVEAASGFTVIAEIPRMSRKAAKAHSLEAVDSPRSPAAEGYRVIRGAVAFALGSKRPPARYNGNGTVIGSGNVNGSGDGPVAPVLMVTSALPGEGKTVTAANLAAVFAEDGYRVLVLNCDFRRPRIHHYLLDADHLTDADEFPEHLLATRIAGVTLVTGIGGQGAETNPSEVVAQQQRIIEAGRQHYDLVILDTAPFLATNDASGLLPQTDLVAVVVRCGRTTAAAANRTAEALGRFEAPVLGVVFNGSEEKLGGQYYYYGYTQAPERSETPPPVPPETPPETPPVPPVAEPQTPGYADLPYSN